MERSTVRRLFLSLIASASPALAATTRPAALTKDQYRAFGMTHGGDAGRGKALFFDEARVACAKCHTVAAIGGKVGPDLTLVGDKFGRGDLADAVLNPSASIAVGYSTTIVKLKSGETLAGVIKDATDSEISLAGANGNLSHLRAVDIQRRKTTDDSLMPEGLHEGLTPEEFSDLLAYLTMLKVPETASATLHGMPAVIPELARPIRLVPFHTADHRFEHPVWFGPAPGVAGADAVVEHESGKVWMLRKSGDHEEKSLFLDTGRFQTGTRGLLGMAFHPGYASNRRYFVVKHTVADGKFASIVLEGEASADLTRDSSRPLRQVLRLDEATNVHYGGGLQFGPDGCLYVGMGDSGPQGDPQGHAQDPRLLLGKMLRIDVDHARQGEPYSIPPDNPFVGREGIRPEIWAMGLREPWRFSFDPATGDLWEGEVGQDLFEEVNILHRGGNYGWNVYEGFESYTNKYRRDGDSYTPPVFAYTRKYGASCTGGFVYRAEPNSSFNGVYVFGDYVSSRLFGLTQEHGVLKEVRQLGVAPEHPVSFGRGAQGELYCVGYEGTIDRIDFSESEFK